MKKSDSKKKRIPPAKTRFAYPKAGAINLRCSRKGRNLSEEMRRYAEDRLLPKLRARTETDPNASKYRAVDAKFRDACVYLTAWLEYEGEFGGAEFPFARLYPVRGGRYNLSLRRLIDWARAENFTVTSVDQMFFLEAPSAKFWSKIATHKTFEECVEILVQEPTF